MDHTISITIHYDSSVPAKTKAAVAKNVGAELRDIVETLYDLGDLTDYSEGFTVLIDGKPLGVFGRA